MEREPILGCLQTGQDLLDYPPEIKCRFFVPSCKNFEPGFVNTFVHMKMEEFCANCDKVNDESIQRFVDAHPAIIVWTIATESTEKVSVSMKTFPEITFKAYPLSTPTHHLPAKFYNNTLRRPLISAGKRCRKERLKKEFLSHIPPNRWMEGMNELSDSDSYQAMSVDCLSLDFDVWTFPSVAHQDLRRNIRNCETTNDLLGVYQDEVFQGILRSLQEAPQRYEDPERFWAANWAEHVFHADENEALNLMDYKRMMVSFIRKILHLDQQRNPVQTLGLTEVICRALVGSVQAETVDQVTGVCLAMDTAISEYQLHPILVNQGESSERCLGNSRLCHVQLRTRIRQCQSPREFSTLFHDSDFQRCLECLKGAPDQTCLTVWAKGWAEKIQHQTTDTKAIEVMHDRRTVELFIFQMLRSKPNAPWDQVVGFLLVEPEPRKVLQEVGCICVAMDQAISCHQLQYKQGPWRTEGGPFAT